MNISSDNSESSDSDIFIVKQIKPVNKLTLQEALLIKHQVINSHLKKKSEPSSSKALEQNILETQVVDMTTNKNSRKANKEKNKKISDKTFGKLKKKKKLIGNSNSNNISIKTSLKNNDTPLLPNKKLSENDVLEKKKVNHKVETGSPLKSYFSSSDKTPVKETIEKRDMAGENISLSPGISRKRKKFRISKDISPAKNNYVKCSRKIFNENFSQQSKLNRCLSMDFNNDYPVDCSENVTSGVDNNISTTKTFMENQLEFDNLQKKYLSFCKKMDEEKCKNNSELLCFLLKKIIHDETKKQINLEQESLNLGKNVETLLTKYECEILEKFLNLEEKASQLFVRMLCRKNDWHRVSTIVYNDIGDDLENDFNTLYKENFVDVNIDEEDLATQLHLLRKPEIHQLCKLFNICIKANNSQKKINSINSLISNLKNQKSVSEMFTSKKSSRLELLKLEIKNMLGMCIKLNKNVRSAFHKIFLLFSFPHYYDEEEKRFSNQLFMCIQVYRNTLKFPDYVLSPTIVFQTRYDFEMYERALIFQDSFKSAISNKRYEDFLYLTNKVEKELLKLLKDDGYKTRFIRMKPFLKKFSAGSIYVKILTKFCETFKSKTDKGEIIRIAQMLINQDLFGDSQRGKWYEILSLTLEHQKEYNASAEILIKAQSDPLINEIQKLTLQLRGQSLLKKKSNGIEKTHLREILDDVCTISVLEPPSIQIRGKALSGNEPGYKAVYVENNSSGKTYSSVEERAILYYKANGFTEGYHSEGFIVQTIYFLLFYDIIYGMSPPGVFQSSYQTAPLDLFSESFYANRKEAIDILLNDMCYWSEKDLETKLKNVYNRNFNVSCVINWKEYLTPKLFCNIVKSITLPVFSLICKRFIFNFRVANSGFPDLTLWNSETKKCKFVEVKSPNDKLSPAQRIWLNYLRNIGIDCEVCNVKNISTKKCLEN